MSSSNSRTNIINSNKEANFLKQYHPGAEYLSSLCAHESIRTLSQKVSSLSKNTYSDEEYFGDTNNDYYKESEAGNNNFDEESVVQPSLNLMDHGGEYSSDGESFSGEAEDEHSDSEHDSSLEDDSEFFKLPTKFQHITTMYDAMKHKIPG